MKEPFEILLDKHLIFPGSIIDYRILEEIFNVTRDSKAYVWKSFALKERIKLDGYFVTEKGVEEGNIRILKTEEMPEYADSKLEKNKNSNEKIALIMKAHDISNLTEEQKKRHKHVQMKAARCASAMQQELYFQEVL